MVLPALRSNDDTPNKVAAAVLAYVGRVPRSKLSASKSPAGAARKAANAAAAKAALAAGSLALPPGPLGWLTLLPEMIAVWKIQSQMVADIASLYGRSSTLSKEHLIYCLFKHTASQAVRDLVVRVGERLLVKQVTTMALQTVAKKIGVKVSQGAVAKAAARWLPIVGAMGVGAYAYYDTAQVAKTAMELFEYDNVSP